MRTLLIASLWLVPVLLMFGAYLLLRRSAAQRRGLERLFTQAGPAPVPDGGDSAATGFLRRWLMLAGYRNPAAPPYSRPSCLRRWALGLLLWGSCMCRG